MIRMIGKIGRCWERLKGVRNYFFVQDGKGEVKG